MSKKSGRVFYHILQYFIWLFQSLKYLSFIYWHNDYFLISYSEILQQKKYITTWNNQFLQYNNLNLIPIFLIVRTSFILSLYQNHNILWSMTFCNASMLEMTCQHRIAHFWMKPSHFSTKSFLINKKCFSDMA